MNTPEKQSIRSPFSPNKQGKILQSSARKNVLHVFNQLRREQPNETVNETVRQVSKLTGVSRSTVYKVKKEVKSGIILTPGKKRPGSVGKRTRLLKYDDFTLTCVRRKIHSYFRRNEIPTLNKLLVELNKEKDIFPEKICRTTLYRLLKDLGFSYKKRNRKSCLIERNDIILWRRRYLREIKKHRNSGRKIYYLDETWANSGHTVSRVWQDEKILSAYDAAKSGLTTGLAGPSGKGSRLIITHIGSDDGFVEDSSEIFVGKKSGDYHEEMDGNHFETWFSNILPKLQPNSVIVMDNASYHSVKCEKIPIQSWRKAEIQDWLTTKNILWDTDMIKVELLEKVKEVKDKYSAYRVDTMASKAGHEVVRLPPYHCELNPIELIWSQIKGYIARENKSYKLKEVQRLAVEGIGKVTAKNWQDSISHVIKKELEFWELDGLMENVWESQKLVINFEETDSETETGSSNSEELSEIDLLD